MSHLTKRKGSSYWHIRYTHPITGKTTFKSTKSKEYRQALSLKKEFDKKMAKGAMAEVVGSKGTLAELAEKYCEWVKDRRSPKWSMQLGRMINNEILPFIGKNTRITKITKNKLYSFQTYLIDRKLSKRTVNLYVGTLRAMLRKVPEWYSTLRDWNPPRIEELRLEVKPPRFFSEEECDHLLHVAKEYSEPIYLTVAFARYCGFRKSEIMRLKWEDIDLKENRIMVDTRKNKHFLGVPIHPKLAEILMTIPKTEREGQVIKKKGEGFRLDIRYPWEQVRKIAGEKHGVRQDLGLHGLRHSFGAHLAQKGVGIHALRELMGHKDLQVTQRYAHLNDERLREDIEKL